MRLKPWAMGTVMGALMLWMLHDSLMNGTGDLTTLILFGGAHVAAVAVVALAGLFASRLAPGLKPYLDRLHRPSPRHVAAMICAAAVTAGAVHLAVHGGVIAWT